MLAVAGDSGSVVARVTRHATVWILAMVHVGIDTGVGLVHQVAVVWSSIGGTMSGTCGRGAIGIARHAAGRILAMVHVGANARISLIHQVAGQLSATFRGGRPPFVYLLWGPVFVEPCVVPMVGVPYMLPDMALLGFWRWSMSESTRGSALFIGLLLWGPALVEP